MHIAYDNLMKMYCFRVIILIIFDRMMNFIRLLPVFRLRLLFVLFSPTINIKRIRGFFALCYGIQNISDTSVHSDLGMISKQIARP